MLSCQGLTIDPHKSGAGFSEQPSLKMKLGVAAEEGARSSESELIDHQHLVTSSAFETYGTGRGPCLSTKPTWPS